MQERPIRDGINGLRQIGLRLVLNFALVIE